MQEKDNKSKEKILMTAAHLFARKGFKGTTIRDICKEADTYQVSINYYFQGKENLFHEAFIKAFEMSNISELNKKAGTMPAEEFINEAIKLKISCLFDDGDESLFWRILSQVFFEQIEIPEFIIEQTFKKMEDSVKDSLRKIADNKLTDDDIDYCHFLVMSQLFTLKFHPIVKKKFIECDADKDLKTQWMLDKIKASLMAYINNPGVKQ